MTKIFDENVKQVEGVVDIGADIVSGGLSATDLRVLDVLEQMLIELKKIEYHLSIASDTTL